MGLINGSRTLEACLFLAVVQAQKLRTSSRILCCSPGAGPLIPIPVKCFNWQAECCRAVAAFASVVSMEMKSGWK